MIIQARAQKNDDFFSRYDTRPWLSPDLSPCWDGFYFIFNWNHVNWRHPTETSLLFLPSADKVGAKLRPPACRRHKDEGQRGRSEPPQQSVKLCGRSTPLPSLFHFLHPRHKLPPRTPPPSSSTSSSTKDKQRVGVMPRSSPPSGAACLCQDVSLHIVMKGVIKVTAGWNAASLRLDSSSRLSLRVAFTSSACPPSRRRSPAKSTTLFIMIIIIIGTVTTTVSVLYCSKQAVASMVAICDRCINWPFTVKSRWLWI